MAKAGQTASVTPLWHYVALLGVYRLFYVLNWIVKLSAQTDLSCLSCIVTDLVCDCFALVLARA